ncbi:MAG TPA: flavin monoamine oxidase family protein [Solirubrobacterales bacterium]|nr:flavin monoamine oxidase family protein [Solirubrobacterales bacterium]
MEADVAIVGAGLAGLVAARRIAAAGKRPIVIEARDRVGGRLLNEEIGNGKVVEVGGQWIGPTQERIAALAAELGVATFPTHDEGRHLIEIAGKLTSYSGPITAASVGLVRDLSRAISPLALADFEQARGRLDRMASSVPLEQPWLAPQAVDWDGQTFATWIGRNTRTAAARSLFELATEAVWAAEPSDVSLLHVLFYTRSGSGFNTLLGTDGGAQQDRFHGGSQRIALLMAEQLGEDCLRLAAPVRRIEHGRSGVVLHADVPEGEADGLIVRAQQAIVAVPPTLAGRIAYDPPLPARRDQLTQRMPQGTVIKTMAIYERPFWREEGLSGQAATDGGPARVVFDNSPPDGSPGVLLGFLEGRLARQWGARDAGERREAILAGHARLFGPEAALPERFIERVWAEEEWTRGCYGCLMTTGGWTEYGSALRAPVGPLHWAGAETATVWNGYMDGAVQSGERAAAEALAAFAV